ncbi:hypothetical protein MPH_09741 [Macrophomina phaseolina MS6]|uniref:Uncharacterized protein n=2 Tax=Macrophomina phaseolina TaxID=35725 RepID=K2QTT7_MACPH|nr:hypothetical protein MPH_09741 [Macrophomina phaseolina MS6]
MTNIIKQTSKQVKAAFRKRGDRPSEREIRMLEREAAADRRAEEIKQKEKRKRENKKRREEKERREREARRKNGVSDASQACGWSLSQHRAKNWFQSYLKKTNERPDKEVGRGQSEETDAEAFEPDSKILPNAQPEATGEDHGEPLALVSAANEQHACDYITPPTAPRASAQPCSPCSDDGLDDVFSTVLSQVMEPAVPAPAEPAHAESEHAEPEPVVPAPETEAMSAYQLWDDDGTDDEELVRALEGIGEGNGKSIGGSVGEGAGESVGQSIAEGVGGSIEDGRTEETRDAIPQSSPWNHDCTDDECLLELCEEVGEGTGARIREEKPAEACDRFPQPSPWDNDGTTDDELLEASKAIEEGDKELWDFDDIDESALLDAVQGQTPVSKARLVKTAQPVNDADELPAMNISIEAEPSRDSARTPLAARHRSESFSDSFLPSSDFDLTVEDVEGAMSVPEPVANVSRPIAKALDHTSVAPTRPASMPPPPKPTGKRKFDASMGIDLPPVKQRRILAPKRSSATNVMAPAPAMAPSRPSRFAEFGLSTQLLADAVCDEDLDF